MSPMEIVATLVGRKRAMVDLATLCETPPPPLLASPTAAAGRSGSHDNNDNKETSKGMAERRNKANVALCLASMGDSDAPLVPSLGCQKTTFVFFSLQTHVCGHNASKKSHFCRIAPKSPLLRPSIPIIPLPPRVRPFPQRSSNDV